MASQNSGRKRQHRSKAGVNKVGQTDNQKIRDHAGQQQQRQQLNTHNQPPNQIHRHLKQQQIQQQLQQHQQKELPPTQQQQQQQKQYQEMEPLQQKDQQQQQQQQLHRQHPDTNMMDNSVQDLISKAGAVDFNKLGASCISQQNDNSALFAAVICRRHDIVDTLLKSGANPYEKDQQGNTVFMVACKVGDVHIMSTLWDSANAMMNIDHTNKDGETALHLCAASGHVEGCQFLLARNFDIEAKTKSADTALHLSAKNDHANVCQALLNKETSNKGLAVDMHHYILEENNTKQTALCISIAHQHAQVTRLLLDILSPQQQIEYLTSRLKKCVTRPQSLNYSPGNAGPVSQNDKQVFLHGLLVTMSVLLIRLSERRKKETVQQSAASCGNEIRQERCMVNTDVIQSLVMVACNHHANRQIVPIACFLLVYLMEGLSEQSCGFLANENASTFSNSKSDAADSSKTSQTGVIFLEQFIQCRGPENLLHALNSMEAAELSNAIVSVATATPVIFLVRTVAGRSWLETNKCHLTFLKELLLRHRSAFTLLTSTCPLLTLPCLASTCKDFVKLVEVLEAKDREQNLADLIWEEERDRLKRERKKQKRHQKKQVNKQLKKDGVLVPMKIPEGSSEDETTASLTNGKTAQVDDQAKENGKSSQNLGTDRAEVLGGEWANVSQEFIDSISKDIISNAFGDAFASGSCGDETMISKNDQVIKVKSTDFPPISTGSCSKSMINGKTVIAEKKDSVIDPNTKEILALGNFHNNGACAIPKVMRWADVAKLGRNDRGMHDLQDSDNQFKISPNKFSISDWPGAGSLKDSVVTTVEKNEGLVASSGQDASGCSMGNDAWYGIMDLKDISDMNSDEDSSSTTSSTESRSSLVSESFVQTKKLNWLSGKGYLDIERTNERLSSPKKVDVAFYPSFQFKDPQDKTHKSSKQDTPCLLNSGRSSASDGSNLQSTADVTKRIEFDEEKANSLDMTKPLTQSDNILDASSWLTSENDWSCCNQRLAFTTNCNMPLSNAFKNDLPTSLPSSKHQNIRNNVKASSCDCVSMDSTIETNDLEANGTVSNQNVHLMDIPFKEYFFGRNSPSSSIQNDLSFNTHVGHISSRSNIFTQNVVPNCQKNNVHCADLTTSVSVSSMQHRLFPTSTLPSQATNISESKENIKIKLGNRIGNEFMMVGNNSTQTHDQIPSIFTVPHKGKMITTVLLDKVKNPPTFLQQNKVPPLSTLAKNCSEESTQAWNKLIQLQNTSHNVAHPTRNAESLNISNDYVFNLPFSTMNTEVSKTPTSSAYEKFGNCSQTNSFRTHLPQSNAKMPVCTKETQSFSTILINRMQQRRQNTNLLGSSEATELLTYCKTNGRMNTMSTAVFCHDKQSSQCKAQICNTPQKSDSVKMADQHKVTEGSQISIAKQRSSHDLDNGSTSPPVFFPEQIRDDVTNSTGNEITFPGFHDVLTSDFLSEMFSDPFLSDKIASNQIRQKILSLHANQNLHSCQMPVDNGIDLDYYASLYQMRFGDVLGRLPVQERNSDSNSQNTNYTSATPKDKNVWKSTNQPFGASSLSVNNIEFPSTRIHSTRWRQSLQKILDLLWTTRRQHGDIILPNSVPEFSIGMTGSILISLGFLMEGTEVAVLILDKTREYIAPRVLEIMSDPEMDKHFLARCKSHSESQNAQYIAIPLHEYSLCEYLQMCLPACNQNPSAFNQLVCQLLQAVNFLHQGLGMAHGRLAPCWLFIDSDGHLRLTGFGIIQIQEDGGKTESNRHAADFQRQECQSRGWESNGDSTNERTKPNFANDIQATGMLIYYILTRGQHQCPVETELTLMRDRVGFEAFDLISPMVVPDPKSRPTADQCLRHPMFWAGDKKFRLILIVGSDVLTEMKTGVALTGSGAPTMMEILSLVDINVVSPNWIHEVDGTVLKEMRSFRVYKNNLAELTLFVYNCCLHFDKLSNVAKEVLDDPCKYFQSLFPSLFIAIYRSLKTSDCIDRTCYKPFFY